MKAQALAGLVLRRSLSTATLHFGVCDFGEERDVLGRLPATGLFLYRKISADV